jgi:poly(A) polymerase
MTGPREIQKVSGWSAGGEFPSLADADWLRDPTLQRVLRALAAAGGEARIAGGAVRNALMGEPIADVDIATTLSPDQVMKAGEAAGLGIHPTGIEHGTIMLTASGRPFEVTTLRVDVETFGRKARVAFTDDWEADARRRDFTINALYCSAEGKIFDPVEGYPDILRRRIKFVGDPEARIKEDYLRILRYFRFQARYGERTRDRASLAACVKLRQGLDQLSAERIRQELFKLLAARRAVPILWLMAQHQVLEHILPPVDDFQPIGRMARIDHYCKLAPDPLLRLALLARDPLSLRNDLKLTNAEVERLKTVARHPEPQPILRAQEQRAVLYHMGEQAFRDAVRLAWARSGASVNNNGWRQLLEAADRWRRPEFPVNGNDLIARGVAPGPKVGEVLRQLEDWWVASDFKPSKDELLARLSNIGQ